MMDDYRGFKEVNKNGKTGKTKITDTRVLEKEIEIAKKRLKEIFEQKILDQVPEYKQRNIAMGIVKDPERTILLNKIDDMMSSYESFKARIETAADCDGVVAVFNDM